jgi:hypothetical protein
VKLALARLSGRRLAFFGATLLAVSAGAMRGAEPGRGTFESPSRGETLAPGSLVEIRWTAACEAEAGDAGRERNEAELVLSLDGGMTFPIRVSTELSPCASRFAWRVPALASSRARLGLRIGEGQREDEERIEIVSEPFTIPPAPDGESEALYARSGEWWTPERPSVRGTEDSVRPTLGGAAAQLSIPDGWTEIGAPSPVVVLARPALRSTRTLVDRPASPRASAQSPASTPAAPIPLRC